MNTAFLSEINWLAVIAATVAYFFLGAIWYSKALFAKRWIALTKLDATNPEAYKSVAGIMITSALFIFVNCFGLAVLRWYLDISGYLSGFKLGLLTGICFGSNAIAITYLYEKRPRGLYYINAGYIILGNILAAIFICSWI